MAEVFSGKTQKKIKRDTIHFNGDGAKTQKSASPINYYNLLI